MAFDPTFMAAVLDEVRQRCLGAAAHSVGQMAAAIFVTGTPAIAVYLPVMLAASLISGLFTGLCAQFLLDRGKLWKIFLK